MKKIVVVTGGRDYENRAQVYRVLDKLNMGLLIQGGACGVDLHAEEWAMDRRVDCLRMPTDWDSQGKAAGPIRNARMLNFAQALSDAYDASVCLVAFPGGRGTANCVAQARREGIKVLRVKKAP